MTRAWIRRHTVCLLGALLTLPVAVAAADSAATTWIGELSPALDPRAREALQRIAGIDRQLLALRAYLLAGDALAQKWSWSQQQIEAYPDSAEGMAAVHDLEAVNQAFMKANPGYALTVNPQPRSFEIQLAHWNENPGVQAVAESLHASLEQRFGAAAVPAETLRAALIAWRPGRAAPLAAPGLSAHGQARAFDFQIVRDHAVIAGTEAASAHQRWDEAGWTAKLRAAVAAAGNRFRGPLSSPYEPWHYNYLQGAVSP